jgi:alginate O-acetyltransferase complex protein AlgI
MVFSSNIFLFAFLPLTLCCYFALPQKLATKNIRNSILLVLSLIFYSWGELHYLWLLLLSIVVNYFFALRLEKNAKFLTISIAVAVNLLFLGYFKYANFLVENLNQVFSLQIENKKIHLPIGISFFTFHAISYLIDIYRKKCRAQRNIFDLALYISFFPQLIAGPIVRYNAIEKYLGERRHTWHSAAAGIRRFIIGLGKKVIIANPLGELADAVFSSPVSELNPIIAWVGIAAYTLQIYFDFSGYCDMAIGLARVFGFKFPENFNYPYVARSIKDFWRRWHMSLSAWFRDYVYIPLGGNRVSFSRQYFNLFLIFFLCGLWHGASWNFVIWGMIHGAFLVFERVKIGKSFLEFLPKFLQHFYVIFIVMVSWVFFRSPDLNHSAGFLKAMFSLKEFSYVNSDIARLLKSHFVLTAAGLAIIGLSPLVKNLTNSLQKNKIFAVAFDVFLMAIFVFAAMRLSAATHNPFIYFQF